MDIHDLHAETYRLERNEPRDFFSCKLSESTDAHPSSVGFPRTQQQIHVYETNR